MNSGASRFRERLSELVALSRARGEIGWILPERLCPKDQSQQVDGASGLDNRNCLWCGDALRLVCDTAALREKGNIIGEDVIKAAWIPTPPGRIERHW